jgi:hypothetical protein
MPRLRNHLVIAAFAAIAATATTAAVSHNASADREEWSQRRGEGAQLRTDLAYFEAAHLELTRGLERVEHAGRNSSDPRTRASIQRIVDETRQRAGRFVGDDRTVGPRPLPADPAPPRFTTLSQADFDRLAARIKSMNSTDAQETVRTAARGSFFTVDQAIVLLKACSYESSRVEMAVILYPRIVDLNRWFLIDEVFDYSSSRQQVRQRVEKIQSQTQTP